MYVCGLKRQAMTIILCLLLGVMVSVPLTALLTSKNVSKALCKALKKRGMSKEEIKSIIDDVAKEM